jgi:hypothetical protein
LAGAFLASAWKDGEDQPLIVSRPAAGLPVNNGYPALAADSDARLWLAWVSNRERNPRQKGTTADLERTDQIFVKTKSTADWSAEVMVSEDDSLNGQPAVAATQAGVWVAWSARRTAGWSIFVRRVAADLSLSPVVRLGRSDGMDASPALAVDSAGNPVVAWESFRKGVTQILVSRLNNGRWIEPEAISPEGEPGYRPALAVSASGEIFVAWDGGRAGRYRIFVRQQVRNTWRPAMTVPAPEGSDVYAPSIAIDGNRVWVAFAENSADQPDRGMRGTKDGRGPRPRVRAAAFENGVWRQMNDGLVSSDGDVPKIAVSSGGAVRIVFLRLLSHLNFRLAESQLQQTGWSEPRRLDAGEEEYAFLAFPGALKTRIDQRPSLAAVADRIVLAYERGAGWFQNRQVAIRSFPAGVRVSARLTSITGGTYKPKEPANPNVFALRDGAANIYFGDIHTHLLMDDGWTGTPDQFFTFARDRFGLNFGSYTPHAESNKLLKSEIGFVQRAAAAFHQQGRFIAFSGWEWTQGDFKTPQDGHKHVLYETDDQPFFSATESDSDSALELQNHMRKTNGIMFAHHVARGATGGANFEIVDPVIEPGVEIASHWGRFEFFRNPGHTRDEVRGSSVQDAWRRGLRIGVVGGSDNHDLYTERISALTAILAPKLERRTLLESLRKRHCYATTGERIVLDFRVNGALMGSEIRSAQPPRLQVAVEGTATLEKVEIVKFWAEAPDPFPVVYAVQPDSRSISFEWQDQEFRRDCAYYLRVTQQADPRVISKKTFGAATAFPNEMAWSSPVWVTFTR